MGRAPNDLIVTLDSQYDDLIPASSQLNLAFKNLAHTKAIPDWAAVVTSLISPTIPGNDNVLDSNLVNAAVLCVLISSGGNPACGNPIDQGQSQAQQKTSFADVKQTVLPQSQRLFSAPGRFEVEAPSNALIFAEENVVSLRVHAPGLTQLETRQVQYSTEDLQHIMPHFPAEGFAIVPVVYDSDGHAFIKIIPRVMGEFVLRIVGRFPDHGETRSEITLVSRPPERPADKLIVPPFVNTYLDHKHPWTIEVKATYPAMKEQVEIDRHFVSFRLRSADASTAVTIEPSGLMESIRTGQALVETQYGGWVSLTCVIVRKSADENDRTPPHYCKSLLRPGEKLGVPFRR